MGLLIQMVSGKHGKCWGKFIFYVICFVLVILGLASYFGKFMVQGMWMVKTKKWHR